MKKKIFLGIAIGLFAVGLHVATINASSISGGGVGGGGGAAGALLGSNNLSDVQNSSTALTNLGGLSSSSAATTYVPYSGATSNINIGSFNVNANQVTALIHTSLSTTTPSVISNFDNTLYVPWNWTKLVYGDWGGYIGGWYAAQATVASSVLIMVPAGLHVPSSSWLTAINFGTNGERASMQCVPGGGSEMDWGSTSSIAITENTGAGTEGGAPMGHLFGAKIDGCLIVGVATTLNFTSSTGIKVGGLFGWEGGVISNNTIKNFGTGIEYSSNTWQMKTVYNSISQNMINIQQDQASNSGETMSFDHNDFFDPLGTSTPNTATGCITINGNNASEFWTQNSFDDCGVIVGAGDLNMVFEDNHFENPAANTTYGAYYYVTVNSSTFSNVNFWNDTFMNDATNTAQSPGAGVAFVNCGGFCYFQGGAADQNGAAATVTSLVTNAMSASQAVETVCNVTNINGSSVTDWINGNTPVLYQTSGCLASSLGSWAIGNAINSANQDIFYDGGGAIGNFNPTGWNIGSGTAATTTLFVTGSVGGNANVQSGNVTLTATSPQIEISTNAGAVTSTLPNLISSQGEDFEFYNRGTTAESVTVGTSTDRLSLAGVNTGTTTSISAGGVLELYNEQGTFWDKLR